MTDRLAAFVQHLPSGVDAVLLNSDVNRRYYLNFASSAGTVIATKDKNYFIIDSRYHEAAQAAVQNCEVVLQESKLNEQIAEILRKHDVKTLAVEADRMTVLSFNKLRESLTAVEVLGDDRVSGLIKKQREKKSQQELDSIAAAQKIADKTFSHILNFIKQGKTELDIAIEMEEFSRRNGSERPAFDFIVAAGKNSSKPHAVPSDNAVKAGDFITLDFGCTVNGYCSDMTRTVAVGHISDKQREVYELVKKAQLAALKVIKAGVFCFEVDKAARNLIDATPYKGLFGHGLGHSLGLEIHESPNFNTQCRDILPENAVMSVEPGVYIPGEFGVRIEDIVVATKTSCINLSSSDKGLILL